METGTLAPDFTLTSDTGEQISLSQFRGHKVVIYFYPKADTPGCTAQACAVRDAFPKITEKDVVVIGISADKPEALRKFREKYKLPFILLSDPDYAVAKAYGAVGEKTLFGKKVYGIIRSHFAVDEEGRLNVAELRVNPLKTAELALKLE